jgi:hypothetical protein
LALTILGTLTTKSEKKEKTQPKETQADQQPAQPASTVSQLQAEQPAGIVTQEQFVQPASTIPLEQTGQSAATVSQVTTVDQAVSTPTKPDIVTSSTLTPSPATKANHRNRNIILVCCAIGVGLVLISLIVNIIIPRLQASSNITNNPIPTSANAQVPTSATTGLPSPGKWSGPAEFGTLAFTVNQQGTGITYVEYTFNEYSCGNTSRSGTIGNGQETGWEGQPITNGQFTFEGSTMTIKGVFDPSGTTAMGTWVYPECNSSGTWKTTAGSPSNPSSSNSVPAGSNPSASGANSPLTLQVPASFSPSIKISTCAAQPTDQTYLCMTSEPGDWVGNGKQWLQTSGNSTFTVNYRGNGGVSVSITTAEGDWSLEFTSPIGEAWVAGLYTDAQRSSFREAGHPGMDVSGMGRGCNTDAGKFELLELTVDTSGNVTSFAINFEQYCDGGPALVGVLRYNSSIAP